MKFQLSSVSKQLFSLLFAVFFFLITLPDALLHSLVNHQDTHDCFSAVESISAQHIHCGALQLSLPAFSAVENVNLQSHEVVQCELTIGLPSSQPSFFLIVTSGRAPPSLA